MPLLDESGQTVAGDSYSYWLVIGNTCDFERDLQEVRWSQVVPVVIVPQADIDRANLQGTRSYNTSRSFYLPPWPGSGGVHGVASFLMPVTIDKRGLTSEKAQVKARLSYIAWVLLHSCMIRFLARGDRRFAE